jgi:hypothetical protein
MYRSSVYSGCQEETGRPLTTPLTLKVAAFTVLVESLNLSQRAHAGPQMPMSKNAPAVPVNHL